MFNYLQPHYNIFDRWWLLWHCKMTGNVSWAVSLNTLDIQSHSQLRTGTVNGQPEEEWEKERNRFKGSGRSIHANLSKMPWCIPSSVSLAYREHKTHQTTKALRPVALLFVSLNTVLTTHNRPSKKTRSTLYTTVCILDTTLIFSQCILQSV